MMQQFAQTSQSWLWLQLARTRRGEVLSAEVTISNLVDTEVVEIEAMYVVGNWPSDSPQAWNCPI